MYRPLRPSAVTFGLPLLCLAVSGCATSGAAGPRVSVQDAAPASPQEPAPAEGSESKAAGTPDDTEALARASQNPIADLISLPLQNNTDFGIGPEEGVQNTLNVQPVWPVELTDDWRMITRTILPVIYQGELVPGTGDEFGLGDTNFTAFFSPTARTPWIWGVGPSVLIPTATDSRLGAGEWGAGVNAIALTMPKPWVLGCLLGNVWSFDGSVNVLTFQPFANFNFGHGWYVNTNPIINANWEASSEDRWKIPLGAGVGKIMKIGKQPINVQLGYYSFVETPTDGPEWQLRVQVQFLFPK